MMSNLIILDVDDWVIERLSRCAEIHGRAPALEAKAILQAALGQPPAGGCQHANAICENLAASGKAFNSVEFDREGMTRTAHGRINGKTIELDDDLGVPNGQEVEVVVRVIESTKQWGEGIRRSAGAAADVADFDEVFAQVERERRAARFWEADE
jgi:hypothetical protein